MHTIIVIVIVLYCVVCILSKLETVPGMVVSYVVHVSVRTVIKVWVTCCLDLHNHNKPVTLFVNCVSNSQVIINIKGPSNILRVFGYLKIIELS